MSEPTAVHPPLIPEFGVDPGCDSCGTCMDHDGCADPANPLGPNDCENCGACVDCIALCGTARQEEMEEEPDGEG